jgi:transposase
LKHCKPEIFWRRTVRKKLFHKTDKARPPVIEPAPLPSIPGTLLAPALTAQILTDNYQDHLPHYRQSQRFRRRHGIDIGRKGDNDEPVRATASVERSGRNRARQ